MSTDPHRPRFSQNPLFQLAVAFAFGIVFASYIQPRLVFLIVCLMLCTCVVLLAAIAGRLHVGWFGLMASLFLVGACLTSVQLHVPSNQLKKLIQDGVITPNRSVALTGVVTGPVEIARDGIHFSLNVEQVMTAGQTMASSGVVSLIGYFKNAAEEESYRALGLQSGSRVAVRTKLDRAEQYRNPGVSMRSEYLDAKGIDAIATIRGPASITQAVDQGAPNILTFLYRWRALLQRNLDAHLSSETAGVLAAAMLGNRHNLSTAAAERFREGGTFHILVISGAHITFIGGLVLAIARRVTIRRWLQLVASATIVWLYTLAVGAEVSVVRAALMFSFIATGHLLFRSSLSVNSLGCASLIILVWSPKDLFDPSLQLTLLSVLAIVAVGLPILNRLNQVGKWRPSRQAPSPPECPRWLRVLSESLFWSEAEWRREQKKLSHSYRLFKTPAADWLEQCHLQRPLRFFFCAVVVTSSVQIFLLPVQILYFHRLSVSSLVLNVVVGVLLAALAAAALPALLCAQVSSSLAAPLVAITSGLNWLMTHSVDPFTRLGIASIRVAEYSGPWRLIYILYYVPLVLFALVLERWRPVRGRFRNPEDNNGGRLNKASKSRNQKYLAALWITQSLMFLSLVLHPGSAPAPAGKLRIDFLDVGQGDSLLLTMPDGTTLLVDGGGRPQFLNTRSLNRQRSIGEMVVCEYLWHRGLHSVDYVLATHADADHMDGLIDVVKNFKVRAALVGRVDERDSGYTQFAEMLLARDTPVQIVQAGDVLTFGDVEINVLWPPRTSSIAEQFGNNDSVVLRVRFGERTFLLTGDIEKETEDFLVRSEALRADVVKVPHHGSRTSSTQPFVTASQAQLVVISVGQKSMFAHPHEEVVQRWRAAGAEVLTTGQSGMISVTTDGKSLVVNTFVTQ